MTPHTNQVVPVEPTEREKFEAYVLTRPYPDKYEILIQLDNGNYKYIQHEWEYWQAARAAAPQQEIDQNSLMRRIDTFLDNHLPDEAQQQGEPVAEVAVDGSVNWLDHNACMVGAKLFTQPLTADASFNQALELAGNKAQHIMPAEHLSSAEKHVFDDAVIQYRREIMKLKRPTDMVTMTRDKFETHIAAAIGIGLAEAQYRVAGNVGNALDEAKAYVSRALEGK